MAEAIPNNAPKFKVVAELSEKLVGEGNGALTFMVNYLLFNIILI